MAIPSPCQENTTGSKIVFAENDTKIYFLNPQNIPLIKIKVDDCAIKVGKRCDHLLLFANPNTEHYVELKGSRVLDAVEQLKASIKQLSNPKEKPVIKAYIISKTMPRGANTELQVAKDGFRKQLKAQLFRKNSGEEIPLY